MKSNTQSHTTVDHPDTPILTTRISSPEGDSSILTKQNNAATTIALICLNEIGTLYIKLLLRDHMPFERSSNNKNIQPNKISYLLSSADLVKAFVNITQCISQISHCGRSGFIVDVSANT